ncbi:MAG: RNA polymerase sigma factor [Solirubrobacteraceae bacterium]
MPVQSQPQHANDAQLAELVRRVRAGDPRAWTQLVARYDRGLRSIARSYRLGHADVDDVVQATWVSLYEHVDRLRDPGAIAGWLATTTRRGAMRLLQRHVREHLSDDPRLGDSDDGPRPEAAVIAAESRSVLRRAVAELPGRQRDLLTLLVTEPDADYRQISATLSMPLGSIGPIRARGLARLGRDGELRAHHLGSG